MTQDWSDATTAQAWDRAADAHNPSRREQLDILVSVVEGLWQPDTWLLDLGCGSGQVEELLFQRLPAARVVGIDSSQAMLAIARERLTDRLARCQLVVGDLADLESVRLPDRAYRLAIAVQSLHHLEAGRLRAAYRWLFDRLEPGGVFLLLDRLRVPGPDAWPLLRLVWQRQDRLCGSDLTSHEGTDLADHQVRLDGRGDRPVLLQEHLRWLGDAGFCPTCLHLHANRALIAGCKPE